MRKRKCEIYFQTEGRSEKSWNLSRIYLYKPLTCFLHVSKCYCDLYGHCCYWCDWLIFVICHLSVQSTYRYAFPVCHSSVLLVLAVACVSWVREVFTHLWNGIWIAVQNWMKLWRNGKQQIVLDPKLEGQQQQLGALGSDKKESGT